MKTNTEVYEEQAELARARLKKRFDTFSNKYSLRAYKEAGRQFGQKREMRSAGTAIESMTQNPASSALLALAAGQLLKSRRKTPNRSSSTALPAAVTSGSSESFDDSNPIKKEQEITVDQEESTARASAISWAKEHRILSGVTALAISIGAAYVLINGRRHPSNHTDLDED